MALVTGALGRVIPMLWKLVKDEYNLQTGLRKKITCLARDLESMHAVLRKVADVPPDQLDDGVKLWAQEVRELSYDVEDILDSFLVSVDGREARDPNRFKRATKKICKLFSKGKARHQIEGMIKTISEQADVVAERHRRYRAEDIVAKPAAKSKVDPRLAAMYTEVTQLVGIKKPSAQLISMLSLAQEGDEASNKKMKIVSVVGTGGLGKTTLAKTVYDKVKVHFQCGAFVPVGRDPDLKKVFRDVLIELDKGKYMDSKYEKLDERQLINELREYLGRKRYFIVIDDIWEIESWKTIKLALVQDNCGISRVITTTRKLEVARECGEVYKLEPLSFDKSEKLFYTRIFGSEGKSSDTQLDEASDKMLKKCDGVPLAIITVASLLVGKSRAEWIEVCHTIVFRDKNKNHQQVSDTEWILSLSYYDLPAHLKTCLLYLSAFPEDFVIDKGPLIRKWVAEGFVHNKEPGTSLFEVGEEYFNELINRSMIQAVESEWWDDMVIGCRLHDMVLDLLRVRSREENFITISRNTSISEGTSSPSNRVRRLVHQNKTEEQTHQESLLGMDLQHVRTFISCNSGTITASKVQSFGLLRVLHLEDCREVNVEHVDKLLHLRYLGITGTQIIGEFPEGIGALKFLQTLDFDSGQEKVLPSSVGLLTQLTRLRPGYNNPPSGVIEKLTSLEDLQIFCHGPFAKELSKLRELRVLKCSFHNLYEGFHSDLVESLGNLHKIRHLELDIYVSDEASEQVQAIEASEQVQAIWDKVVLPRPLQRLCMKVHGFRALPSCINPSNLPNLTYLELTMHLGEQGLKILATLPELRHFKLKAYDTVTITVNDGFFCKLTSLVLPYSRVLFVLNEDSSISFTIWNHEAVDIEAFERFRLAGEEVVRCGRAHAPASAARYGHRTAPAPPPESNGLFGSQTGTVRAPAFMPNLQMLCFYVDVGDLVYHNGSCDKLGLEYHLPSLQKVRVNFNSESAGDEDVWRQATALKHAIKAHPNRPTLQIDVDWDFQIDFDSEDEDDSSTDQEEEDSSTDHEEGDSSPDHKEEE